MPRLKQLERLFPEDLYTATASGDDDQPDVGTLYRGRRASGLSRVAANVRRRVAAEFAKMERGVPYKLAPAGQGSAYRWAIAPEVSITRRD